MIKKISSMFLLTDQVIQLLLKFLIIYVDLYFNQKNNNKWPLQT